MRAQVDGWLADYPAEYVPAPNFAEETVIVGLAAEVRALREENARLSAELTHAQMMLARVRELPGKWRDIVQRVRGAGHGTYSMHEAVLMCAKDLEAALDMGASHDEDQG